MFGRFKCNFSFNPLPFCLKHLCMGAFIPGFLPGFKIVNVILPHFSMLEEKLSVVQKAWSKGSFLFKLYLMDI